jgi:hypothetical protein
MSYLATLTGDDVRVGGLTDSDHTILIKYSRSCDEWQIFRATRTGPPLDSRLTREAAVMRGIELYLESITANWRSLQHA